jgi:hypothetical protein
MNKQKTPISPSDIRLIQLNDYIRPKVYENKSKGMVMNGVNNQFYQDVIDRKNGSPTNSAILRSYSDLVYGKGIRATNASFNTSDWLRFKTILKTTDLRRIIDDFCLQGEATFQVIKAKNKKELGSILHLPVERTAPAIENDEEEIESYFYCRDWKRQTKFPPEEFPAFGYSNADIEIYKMLPYSPGQSYFSSPDYMAGLPYCQMEEEIANYYINHIKNGLSFGYIINIPDGNSLSPEEKDILERKIKEKLTGSSNAGKFVLSFNGRDAEITVTPLQVNDAHKQWEYLTAESRQQIMTAHRVVSPMLFGIKDATGFGNNADELDTAEAQLVKRVIAPKQQFIIDCLQEVLTAYGINLDLYFKPLTDIQPVQMSSHVCCSDEKKKTELDAFIDLGENEDLDSYDLVDEIEVDYEEEERLQLASTGTAIPNAKSSQDGEEFIVRYKYVGSTTGEREFCNKMVNAKKIYRKEDIIAMGSKAVNPGWGPNGANTYSIWLYKGGGDCHHKWNRVIYVKKGVKIDVNSPLAEIISTSEARRKGYKLETNDTLVSVEPRNMDYNGFLPTNKRFK